MHLSHLTIATDGRLPLLSGDAALCEAVCALARIAGGDLVLFCFADDHLHVVTLADAVRTGKLARAIVLALRPLAHTAVEPARTRRVESRSHMEWLVRYVLTQTMHHGLTAHPALFAGSCFQDLVHARWVHGMRLRIAEALPRYRRRGFYESVGLPAVEIGPADDDVLRAAGLGRIGAAAAAALAVPPDLAGNRPRTVLARRAVAHLGHAVGFDTGDLVRTLGVSPRSARRLDETPVPPDALRAIRVRLALEDAVTRAAVQRP